MFTVSFPNKQLSFEAPLSVYDAAREAELISREVIACSVYNKDDNGNPATYFLTDGDPARGYWAGHKADRAAWLKLDLLEVCEVSSVKIHSSAAINKAQRCKTFTVLVSEDGVTYTEVAAVEGHDWGDCTQPLELTFDKVKARYIRIICDTGRATGFGEIEVYG